jgi:hypothetical protein
MLDTEARFASCCPFAPFMTATPPATMGYAEISPAFGTFGTSKVFAALPPSMGFTEDGLALSSFVAAFFLAPSTPTVGNAPPG